MLKTLFMNSASVISSGNGTPLSQACCDGPYSAGRVQCGINPNMVMDRRHKAGPSEARVASNQLDSCFFTCMHSVAALLGISYTNILSANSHRNTTTVFLHSGACMIHNTCKKELTESYISSWDLSQGRNRRLSWWEWVFRILFQQ